jgi:hypothetical protein
VWHYWTRLCVASGITPAELLGRSRAKIEGRLTVAGQMKGARRQPKQSSRQRGLPRSV